MRAGWRESPAPAQSRDHAQGLLCARNRSGMGCCRYVGYQFPEAELSRVCNANCPSLQTGPILQTGTHRLQTGTKSVTVCKMRDSNGSCAQIWGPRLQNRSRKNPFARRLNLQVGTSRLQTVTTSETPLKTNLRTFTACKLEVHLLKAEN